MLLTALLLRLPFSYLPYTLEDRLPRGSTALYINHESRKYPTDTLPGHSDRGDFLKWGFLLPDDLSLLSVDGTKPNRHII